MRIVNCVEVKEGNLSVPTEIVTFQIAGASFPAFLGQGKLKLKT